jgi:hypothetical protein
MHVLSSINDEKSAHVHAHQDAAPFADLSARKAEGLAFLLIS